jgi:dipeptidyl aminopeptidase/acylaminoacyl peptidase
LQETTVRRFFALILTILLPAALIAEDGLRPVTHAEVWLMKRLSTPVVSPDGRHAVVAVTEPSYDDEESVSDLWLIDVSGKAAPRRLTATAGAESGVDWSPDGTRIAFSTKRGADEANQIYVLNMDGPGEAVPITNLSTGAATPKWSPDGKRIAFESRIYPGAADDEANAAEKKAREERKYNASAYDIFPIRQWDRWRDDLQTHLFVQDAESGATATNLLFGSDLVSHAGYGGVESLSADSLAPAWTPDGKAIVISATTNLDEAAHAPVIHKLYKVPADGGDITALTEGDGWSCAAAQFAKDGKSVYCQYRPFNDYVYNHIGVARFGWDGARATGEPQVITESFDRSVTTAVHGYLRFRRMAAKQRYWTATAAACTRAYRWPVVRSSRAGKARRHRPRSCASIPHPESTGRSPHSTLNARPNSTGPRSWSFRSRTPTVTGCTPGWPCRPRSTSRRNTRWC